LTKVRLYAMIKTNNDFATNSCVIESRNVWSFKSDFDIIEAQITTKEGKIMTIETANRLYELRKEKGLSQEELAEKLGVSRQAVSKWERSEASPDTDNLIALAKIYGLTLDELVYGKKDDQQSTEAESEVKKDTEKVDIGPTGIFLESADGDKMHINLRGIKVTEGKHIIHIDESGDDDDDFDENNAPTTEGEPETKKDTDKVDIGPNGIFVESSDGDKVQINLRGLKITDGKHFFHVNDDDDDDFDDEEKEIIVKSNGKAKFWLSIPYPIVCGVAYLLFGCLDILGGFGQSWIIFATIPLYYTLINAIFKKSFCEFAYPVFCAFMYLYLGMYHGNWHPSWIIFVTIPLYYPIAGAIDKRIRSRESKNA